MAKIFIQKSPSAFSYSGTMAAAASTSGSFMTDGYSLIGGLAISSASLANITIWQSYNGTNWDTITTFALSACSGSAYSASVCGKYGRITACGGAVASAAEVRMYFFLRPI